MMTATTTDCDATAAFASMTKTANAATAAMIEKAIDALTCKHDDFISSAKIRH